MKYLAFILLLFPIALVAQDDSTRNTSNGVALSYSTLHKALIINQAIGAKIMVDPKTDVQGGMLTVHAKSAFYQPNDITVFQFKNAAAIDKVLVRDASQAFGINVQWAGVTGDSVTNNTANLRKIAKIPGTYFFPDGNYIGTDSIPFGNDVTFIFSSKAFLISKITTANNHFLKISGVNNVKINGLNLKLVKGSGLVAGLASGIYVNRSSNVQINDYTTYSYVDSTLFFPVNDTNFYKPMLTNGYWIDSSVNVQVNRANINGGCYAGWRVGYANRNVECNGFYSANNIRGAMTDSRLVVQNVFRDGSNNVRILNGVFEGNYQVGMKLEGGTSNAKMDNVTFINNAKYSNGKNVGGAGVVSMGANNSTLSNLVFRDSTSDVTASIFVYRYATDISLHDINIQDAPSGGIKVNTAGKNVEAYNLFFKNLAGDAFRTGGKSTNIQLHDFRFYNIGSAGAFWEAGVTGGYIDRGFVDSAGARCISLSNWKNGYVSNQVVSRAGKELVRLDDTCVNIQIRSIRAVCGNMTDGGYIGFRLSSGNDSIDIKDVFVRDSVGGHINNYFFARDIPNLTIENIDVPNVDLDRSVVTTGKLNYIGGQKTFTYNSGTQPPNKTQMPQAIYEQYLDRSKNIPYFATNLTDSGWRTWKHIIRDTFRVDFGSNFFKVDPENNNAEMQGNGAGSSAVEFKIRSTASKIARVSLLNDTGAAFRLGMYASTDARPSIGYMQTDNSILMSPTTNTMFLKAGKGFVGDVDAALSANNLVAVWTVKAKSNNSSSKLFSAQTATSNGGTESFYLDSLGRVGIKGTGTLGYLTLPNGDTAARSSGMRWALTNQKFLKDPEPGAEEVSTNGRYYTPSPTVGRRRYLLGDSINAPNGSLPIGNGNDFSYALPTSNDGTIKVNAGKGTLDFANNYKAVDSLRRVGVNIQMLRNGQWITVYTDSVGAGSGSGGGAALTFNPANLTGGSYDGSAPVTVNTIQNIGTTATPQFAGITTTGDILPDATNTRSLGSASLAYKDVRSVNFRGSGTTNFTSGSASTAAIFGRLSVEDFRLAPTTGNFLYKTILDSTAQYGTYMDIGANLRVKGIIYGQQLKIPGGSPGDVLTKDANGFAVWQGSSAITNYPSTNYTGTFNYNGTTAASNPQSLLWGGYKTPNFTTLKFRLNWNTVSSSDGSTLSWSLPAGAPLPFSFSDAGSNLNVIADGTAIFGAGGNSTTSIGADRVFYIEKNSSSPTGYNLVLIVAGSSLTYTHIWATITYETATAAP